MPNRLCNGFLSHAILVAVVLALLGPSALQANTLNCQSNSGCIATQAQSAGLTDGLKRPLISSERTDLIVRSTAPPSSKVSNTSFALPLGEKWMAAAANTAQNPPFLLSNGGFHSRGAGTVRSEEMTIVTPEPGTLGLVGTGLLGMGLIMRRRFRQDRDQHT